MPGNWEVVYGPEGLRRRARELAHPLVAANLRDAGTGARVFPPYVVRDVGGVRVGVLGFTDPDVPRRQPPGYSQGLVYDGPEELPALVRELREKERADVVLLLSHVGLPKAVDLAGRVPGVDVHLSGDTHERTYEPIERAGAWVVEPGAFGSFLGRLDLTVRGGEVVDRRWQLLELTAERFPAEDPAVLRAVERSLAPFRERLARPIGRTAAPLERYSVLETTLDDVLADAVREAAGTEVALSNGFRFSPPIAAGPITEADLWNAYAVVARLRVGRVTGRALRAFWERELENVFARDPTKRFGGWLPRPSGMTVRFAAAAEPGRRVLDLRVGGVPVEDDRTYTLAACEREGDPPDVLCRIPGVTDARTLEVDAHEAVRRYLAARPTVRAAIEGRVVGVDLPPVLRTQM